MAIFLKRFSLSFLLLFFGENACASYYDTLPKGVRNITYRFIQTGNITGSYNSAGSFKGYNVNANINADSIRGVNSAVDTYLDSLNAADYAQFSFGTFQGNAVSKVSAQAFGAGYGITNHLTVYGFIPFYSAEVDLSLIRTQKGRNNVGTAIQLENLPDVDVRLIQSLFVNYYHYQPLGKWRANDFGDGELGFMYQLNKGKYGGTLVNFGVVAPTGRIDNPDILQDIAFGDGQWDAFCEYGGGLKLSHAFSLDSWMRLTYQFPYIATLRLPDSEAFPITSNSGSSRIKLGNKVQAFMQGNFEASEQWTHSLLYSMEYTEPTDNQSANPNADKILEKYTEKLSHTARFNIGYSTLNLFKRKKFFMPMNFNIAIQSVFAGKNVPRYDRGDFEIRLFF